jgi:FHS family glucose/mannose:H+ symporter-like MFS transporter
LSTEPLSRPALNVWWLTAAAFFGFFVFGFTDNLKGPALPELLDDLAINYSTGGTILLGSYIGFVVASLFAGLLAEARGVKTVLILAAAALLIGVGGFSFANSALFLTLFMLFQGFGLGALELGVSSLIVQLYATNTGRYLNLMAVTHGLGATIAPLYAGWLLSNELSWRLVFRWDLVLAGLLIVFFVLMRFPPKRSDHTEQSLTLRELGTVARSPTLLLSCFALTCYVAVEVSIAAWLVEYLQSVHRLDVSRSTLALSIFFGLIMIGRLVGSALVDRIGYLRAVVIGMTCATLCIGIGLFIPWAFWLLPISGLFISITFPTLTAAVSTLFTKNVSAILGLLFAFAGLGGILGPWVVGLISDRVGIQIGFSLILIFAVLTLLSVFKLERATST